MENQRFDSLKTNFASRTRVLVKQLQDSLDLDDKSMSEILKINPNQLVDFHLAKQSLDIFSLQNLMEHFELSLDSIKTSSVDIDIIKLHHCGKKDQLSEKYTIGAFSKRRTVLNTLDFIKNNAGYHSYDMTERYFQLNKEVLNSPDEYINIHFIEDLYQYLNKYQKLSLNDFYKMGKNNIKTLTGSQFYKSMCKVKHPKELYEKLIIRDIEHLEKNSNYELVSLTNNECKIKSIPKEIVQDTLKVHSIGNEFTCKYREGVFSVLTEFINLSPAIVTETSCCHKGDDFCEFKIDFSKATYEFELHKIKQQLSLRTLH